ncbi:contact-dependent growth inhibition system immunity protein [Rhodopirellula sp. MGV]|uniref:contact-dependent growth inhibition system immunity protein n=1 Tax=Rhodopirellula sp. MGV TaxID=2023130 RepID=UPI000B96DA40|nr:contact-dependent growth inhibition system immunity protein [Rhodopirellula sp. MGV]OYP35136.1 hypothetical protein CGZ80_12080 [Rhodopirellula sp. MGV]PNY34046.1 hypothetical protein C2E31_25435 [Rhodopirellula baltica]
MTTLDELDPPAWQEPETRSGLIAACHHLRSKPLDEFTAEDLRVMIGQQICPNVLLPIAVDRLIGKPLAAGDYYPGDLFVACVNACRKDCNLMERHLGVLSSIAKAILDERPDDDIVIGAAESLLTENAG